MSYNRKTWQNRNSEHPYRRTLTDTTSGTSQTVDVIRAEGVITTEGDAFDANTMNNMEGRIADEFSLLNQKVGDLTQLETEAKNSLVEAINEVAESGGGGGSSTLAGLTDTNIVNQTNGQILKWDSMILKWVNADEGNGGTASSVAYDNTDSGLQATDVQEAIDEVAGEYVKKDFAIIQGTASVMATSTNDGAINATGNDTHGANMGVYNSEIDGSMHMNMSTTGMKELVVYDSNAARSVVIAQDAAGNYSGDLIDMIDEKADIASPAFTGTPTAPTQTAGNNSTRIATTAFVQGEKPSVGSITNLTTVSANSSGWQNVGSVNTAKGSKYLIVITAEFAGNSTGVRQIGISTTSGGSPIDFFRAVGANNMGTVKQQLQLVSILAPSSNTTYYINVAQNSGSGLEIKSKYSLIKLA